MSDSWGWAALYHKEPTFKRTRNFTADNFWNLGFYALLTCDFVIAQTHAVPLLCIEKSSQLLVSVPFWCWCLIIELLTDFLENWFKKKVESLIQFIRRRNRLHVWFLSLTERLSHHSYFYTESCNRVCNFKNIFRISYFCAECKTKTLSKCEPVS